MKIIARIYNDFTDKFGIPRQSGLANEIISKIVFEEKYRDQNAVRGIEEFSHLWLIWNFSESEREDWSPTVRPPRLGGNKRIGVFATRSPFRPNPIGLSSVKLECVELTKDGPVLYVKGADLLNGTPIYDIKPYIPYSDCHPDALGSFTETTKDYKLKVVCPEEILNIVPKEKHSALITVLSGDPRPSYHRDETREYGMSFGEFNVKFKVSDGTLSVFKITQEND